MLDLSIASTWAIIFARNSALNACDCGLLEATLKDSESLKSDESILTAYIETSSVTLSSTVEGLYFWVIQSPSLSQCEHSFRAISFSSSLASASLSCSISTDCASQGVPLPLQEYFLCISTSPSSDSLTIELTSSTAFLFLHSSLFCYSILPVSLSIYGYLLRCFHFQDAAVRTI